jgi:hypothetical protein
MSSSAPSAWQVRARAEQERRRRAKGAGGAFGPYRYDPAAYIRDKLGWEPWSGTDDQPGQVQVLGSYTLALRQQQERDAWEQGELADGDLRYWRPGEVIRNRLRISAGHTVGKTKLASGIINHFFDCFTPSIIYTFAPTWKQIHDLLWKEIKTDRSGKGLPGRILDLELKVAPDHFANGTATSDAGGKGTERVQGQHGKYLMFVLDEAEAIPDFVWNAIDSMASGGIAIVLMLANPRTRSSRFHKAAELPDVRSFRISCIWHPNVLAGREVVPGAVRRQYVEKMLAEHCEVVRGHDPDNHTFEVPWRPGEIHRPDPEFMFRVLGIAPANISDNTLIPVGRFQTACERQSFEEYPTAARIGVDVARFGRDYGTVYVRHNGRVWRAARLYHLDTTQYAGAIKERARQLRAQGVASLHIRVDAGGGFGSGVIDQLSNDVDFMGMFPDLLVLEVHFGGRPYDPSSYADLATEMYAEAAETLKGIAVLDAPPELETDLCDRPYVWRNRQGVAVKKLVEKDEFRKEHKRSPDDGDGFVLAVAPDFIFEQEEETVVGEDRVEIDSSY